MQVLCLSVNLKACAVFSATCLAMLENVAMQFAEIGCYTTSRS